MTACVGSLLLANIIVNTCSLTRSGQDFLSWPGPPQSTKLVAAYLKLCACFNEADFYSESQPYLGILNFRSHGEDALKTITAMI